MSEYELRFILDEKNGKYFVGSNGMKSRYRMEEEGHTENTRLRNEIVASAQIKIEQLIRNRGIAPRLLTFDGKEKSDWVLRQ